MSFVLIFSVALIPFIFGLTMIFSDKNKYTRSISVFLFLLFIWQMDIAILYSVDFFTEKTIELFFRILRFGPIMIMPLMYYFALSLHKMNSGGKQSFVYNQKILFFLITYSLAVYGANLTSSGITGLKLVAADAYNPAYYYPVYGDLNVLFLLNIILVLINTSLLITSNSRSTNKQWKKFFHFLAFSSYFIFVIGILSGFLRIPLYFSILNAVIATIVLFVAYFNMNHTRLVEQSNFLSTILDAYPDYIFVSDKKGRVILFNRALGKLLGIEQEEVDREETQLKLLKMMNTINCASDETHFFRTSDGGARKTQWSSLDINFNGESAELFIGIDVTDRLQNEEMLLKTEKLRVLGELAAGVAHEIRNPLTSIKGFIKLLSEKNSEDLDYLTIISDEIDRINEVVSELLVMAKPQAGNNFSMVDVKKTIQDVKILLDTNAIMNKVSIDLEFIEENTIIQSAEHLIKQVMLNLLKNSIEALQVGGMIRVRVETTQDGRLRIRVIDNGGGIPRSRLKSIGEPFFTTKAKGNGLGLMICFKIVKELKGEMKIRSVENIGTVVDMIIPKGK